MGGYRVQARTADAARELQADALALARAGAGAIVLEGVPREAAAAITAALPIPTIGIGAGPECDGQILVFHDLVNLSFAPQAKFVRRYADASALFHSAIERYREDVEHRAFPADVESYHLSSSAVRQAGASADSMAGDAGTEFDSEDAIVNRDAFEDWGR
jgi:3-methyl-2-oxobutanoate hydroxymethyltransferase